MSKKDLSNVFDNLSQAKAAEQENTPNLTNELDKQFNKTVSKPKVNDTHTRATFLLQTELNDALNELSGHKGRGFKTQFFNYMVAQGLKSYGYDVEYEPND